jgi:cytochrome c553
MKNAFGMLVGMGLACMFSLVPLPSHATDMAERIKPCEACHGNQGRAGPDGYYPRLAGKPAGYLFNQMQNFSQGRRHYTMMRRMMEPLTPAYQREMADYFSALQVPYLPPATPSTPLSPGQATRGKQLALTGDANLKIPACNSCHGETLMGSSDHVPSLLGLPSAYLGAQLSAWSQGNRSTPAPDCMADIAKRLSATDAAAVTAWLATQSVANKTAIVKPVHAPANTRCGSAPELQGAVK